MRKNSKFSIKISKFNKMNSLKVIVISLALFAFCCQAAIDPSNYVWINYNSQNQIMVSPNNEYVVKLPCQARIGKCTYNYTTWPPNWKILPDGSIVLPAEDAKKEGSFAIKVELAEPTGEKMNANLVAKISKGFFSVMDSSQFYKQSGMPISNKYAQASKYQESPLVKNIPAGFPSLKQIENILVTGNDKEIKKFLQQTNDKFAPCRSKSNYLKSAKDIFYKVINENERKISDNKKEIQKLEEMIPRLKANRTIFLKNTGVIQEIEKINEKIDSINNLLGLYFSENLKYRSLAEKSLQKLKSQTSSLVKNKSEQTNNRAAVDQLQQLQLKFNDWLAKAIQDRSSLQRGILSINLLKQTKGLQGKQQIKQFQKNYRNLMVPLVQEMAKLTQIEVKETDLKQQIKQNKNFLAFINDKLAQVEMKLYGSSDGVERTAKILEESNLLNIQISRLQQFMKNQVGGC